MAKFWFPSQDDVAVYLYTAGFRQDDDGRWRRDSWQAVIRKGREGWTYDCI